MSVPVRELPTKKLLARIGLRFFICLMCILFIAVLLKPIFHFTAPFLFAYAVTAIILMPIIKKLSNKFRKFWSIVLVVVLLAVVGLIVGFLVYYLILEVISIAKNWSEYKASIENVITRIADFLGKNTSLDREKVIDSLTSLGKTGISWVKHDLPGMAPALVDKVGSIVPPVASFFLSFLFFIIATYFTCVDYDNINRGFKKYIPNAIRPQLRQIKNSSITATFGYIKAQVIVSSMVAAIAFVVFLIIGQSYAMFWAILVGVIDFIPMLGSSVILVPWIGLLAISGDYKKAIIFAILTFVLFMFRRITEPKVVGDQTGLNPLLTLFSLFVGIKVGGVFGMIIAPIVCMIFVDLIKAGFFSPTVRDVKEIFYRMGRYADMNMGDEVKESSDEKEND